MAENSRHELFSAKKLFLSSLHKIKLNLNGTKMRLHVNMNEENLIKCTFNYCDLNLNGSYYTRH